MSLAIANGVVLKIENENHDKKRLQNLNINKNLIPTTSLAMHIGNQVIHKCSPVS